MLLLKSNPLLVAEASSTIEESPINQVQRIGNGWSRVTTNTATAAALSTPATRPRQLRTTEQSLIISHWSPRPSLLCSCLPVFSFLPELYLGDTGQQFEFWLWLVVVMDI